MEVTTRLCGYWSYCDEAIYGHLLQILEQNVYVPSLAIVGFIGTNYN
jgi:hypothetical protein